MNHLTRQSISAADAGPHSKSTREDIHSRIDARLLPPSPLQLATLSDVLVARGVLYV
jgi:hypothetical protein